MNWTNWNSIQIQIKYYENSLFNIVKIRKSKLYSIENVTTGLKILETKCLFMPRFIWAFKF